VGVATGARVPLEVQRAKRAATRHAYYLAHPEKWVVWAAKSRPKRLAKRLADPEGNYRYNRKHDLKRHYGLTPEQHRDLFIAQGYRCAVCKTADPGRKTGHWCTDHDHTTGIVRGILCNGCNAALGHVKDDPKRLRALADYLERGTLKWAL
jgi:hypothetical protein